MTPPTRKKDSKNSPSKRLAHEAEGTASGALLGAALGTAAGPPGMVAGAIVGGLVGAVTGAVLDSEAARRDAHERELDEAIGVTGGDLGAANLKHPPARVGAYSAASSGAAAPAGETSADGPLQEPDE
jgi:phage tail tape-measure protein